MDEIREPGRSLPVVAAVDVAVCGGGPAGLMAAVAAARSGASTLLIERYGFLGGMATAGLVGPICKFNCQGRAIVGGIPMELVKMMAAHGGAVLGLPTGNIPYDPEVYKLQAQRLVRNAGVRLLLHSYVCGCLQDAKSPGKLTHVIIENKSGRCAVAARVFVDCTGDADIVAHAGLAFDLGGGGVMFQPMSLMFHLGGVDTEHMDRLLMAHDATRYFHRELHDMMEEARQAGMLPNFGGPWVVHGSNMRRGEATVNATRFSGNGADADIVTEAECQAREDMHAIIAFMKQKLPQLADAYLAESATQIGIRDRGISRGLYTLTTDDVLSHRSFDDGIALGAHPIDVHSAKDSSQIAVYVTEPYSIPYRTMVPQGADNLIVAGRTISATREAFATIRVQAQCMAMGEAAGVAASMAARDTTPVGAVDPRPLRETLRRNGAIVDSADVRAWD